MRGKRLRRAIRILVILLVLTGIGFGLLMGQSNLHGLVGRAAGALIALAGVWFLHSPP